MEDLIEFKDVCFSYKKNSSSFVLNSLNFKIKAGESVAVVGSNGSGKSTLSKLLNGIIVPTSGDVFVFGANTKTKEEIFKIRRNVGLVFQDPDNQIVATVVDEEVAFALENLCYEQKEIEKKVDSSLKDVDMLSFKKHLVENLSGGQKSKVCVAGVLAMSPKCIIFDESTSMLDPKSKKEVLKIMKKLNETGTTIINITHDMKEVAFFNRVIVLKDGKILKDDKPKEIFKDLNLIKKAGLCPPQVLEFLNVLEKEGIVKQKTVLNVEECAEVLADFLKGERVFGFN